MTKRVLVAVDGTEASNTALEIACALADSYEAHLGLLCVIEPGKVTGELIKAAMIEGILKKPDYNAWYHSSMFAPGGYTAGGAAERSAYVERLSNIIAEDIVAQAEAYTKDSAAKAIKTFVRSGKVADEILDVATSNGADLIVMGHDQQGLIESLIKSSVAEQVVREATCPCLVYCRPKGD